MDKKKELKELTSIRFLAAFHVVLFHNINLMGNDLNLIPQWLQAIIGYGYCGVTFLFYQALF
ncbi:MAG: hypothetical protein H7177_01945 [Rhizobacter sp.]|nr:hypothetical protein [Bacteriovorax sp.]